MDSKFQSRMMIGIALLVAAAIMIFISLSSPGVYEDSTTSLVGSTAGTSTEILTVAESTVQYPVNLNFATVDQLCSIDGIGEKRAEAIVAYRDTLGKYDSVDQIKNIEGIGDSLYAKIAPYLTV